jgi:hypothetical protein
MSGASSSKTDRAGEKRLVAAARSADPVAGLTHDFYKYPARFSPQIAKAAVALFTNPGDIVLDPFSGGGTSLVEASAAGRVAVGSDISELAAFVSRVKTTLLTQHDRSAVTSWIDETAEFRGRRSDSLCASDERLRNFEGAAFRRVRSAIARSLEASEQFSLARQRAFARCVLLRTAQVLLDCRTTPPTLDAFRRELRNTATRMLRGAEEYASAVSRSGMSHNVKVWTVPAERVDRRYETSGTGVPSLILTSPPYPGVHVLYHRWQLFGRRETPLPFWIANAMDGHGASFFTLGGRHDAELKTYFDRATGAFEAVQKTMSPKTLLLQVVAFANPKEHLPRYLSVLADVGLRECKLDILRREGDGRLWREVPGRKWYAQNSNSLAKSEVVLLHHSR